MNNGLNKGASHDWLNKIKRSFFAREAGDIAFALQMTLFSRNPKWPLRGQRLLRFLMEKKPLLLWKRMTCSLKRILQETRETLRNDFGDLLPRYFLFLKWNILVGSLQKKSIKLKNILECHNKGGGG